MVTEILQKQTY